MVHLCIYSAHYLLAPGLHHNLLQHVLLSKAQMQMVHWYVIISHNGWTLWKFHQDIYDPLVCTYGTQVKISIVLQCCNFICHLYACSTYQSLKFVEIREKVGVIVKASLFFFILLTLFFYFLFHSNCWYILFQTSWTHLDCQRCYHSPDVSDQY